MSEFCTSCGQNFDADERLSRALEKLALAAEDDAGNEEVFNALKPYLLSHEQDIAHGINDFDTLSGVFRALIGRWARK